jgi:hypothetical protein
MNTTRSTVRETVESSDWAQNQLAVRLFTWIANMYKVELDNEARMTKVSNNPETLAAWTPPAWRGDRVGLTGSVPLCCRDVAVLVGRPFA